MLSSKYKFIIAALPILLLLCNPSFAFQTTNMVLISSGSFDMGDAFSEGSTNERPVHAVSLDANYIDRYLVTNSQFCSFLNEDYSNLSISASSVKDATGIDIYYDLVGSDARIQWSGSAFSVISSWENHPVVEVTWKGAKAYAAYRGKRLPTEAEWEMAARGGLAGKRYPWGDAAPIATDANYNNAVGHTTAVGSYTANGYGLYDMAGNVYQLCLDYWDAAYYNSSPSSNPTGPVSGTNTSARGGPYSSPASSMRCSIRNPLMIPDASGVTGFRCAGSATSSVEDWKEYKER